MPLSKKLNSGNHKIFKKYFFLILHENVSNRSSIVQGCRTVSYFTTSLLYLLCHRPPAGHTDHVTEPEGMKEKEEHFFV